VSGIGQRQPGQSGGRGLAGLRFPNMVSDAEPAQQPRVSTFCAGVALYRAHVLHCSAAVALLYRAMSDHVNNMSAAGNAGPALMPRSDQVYMLCCAVLCCAGL
jgi:hypothetical protein